MPDSRLHQQELGAKLKALEQGNVPLYKQQSNCVSLTRINVINLVEPSQFVNPWTLEGSADRIEAIDFQVFEGEAHVGFLGIPLVNDRNSLHLVLPIKESEGQRI